MLLTILPTPISSIATSPTGLVQILQPIWTYASCDTPRTLLFVIGGNGTMSFDGRMELMAPNLETQDIHHYKDSRKPAKLVPRGDTV